MENVAFHTLGCKVNAYETMAMEEKFKKAGYNIVDFESEADIYIINTCSVTNMADRKSRQMLHKAKKKNSDAVIVAVGCYVQAVGDKLLEDSSVDIVIGNNLKNDIVNVVSEYVREHKKVAKIIDLKNVNEYENTFVSEHAEKTRAFIKVQDGCNQFCSYCIIPYTRGRVRSRDFSQCIEEIRGLAGEGYKEVVLTGIHLSSYGIDFESDNIRLIDLIEAVHEIDGIERIRLGSIEPRIITEDFVLRLSKLNKVCPHFHLSLQSGCDETLKRMNRKYTTYEFAEKCAILRKHLPNVALTTDVIVGFPGETEEEFNETHEFLKKIAFYETHIFKYSRRKGTVADKMDNQVFEETKNVRSDILLELDRKMRLEYNKKYLDCTLTVLFEEETIINGIRYYIGHTTNYIKVAVKSNKNICNTIHRVCMYELMENDILYGKLVD